MIPVPRPTLTSLAFNLCTSQRPLLRHVFDDGQCIIAVCRCLRRKSSLSVRWTPCANTVYKKICIIYRTYRDDNQQKKDMYLTGKKTSSIIHFSI